MFDDGKGQQALAQLRESSSEIMSYADDERRWKRIQDFLSAEASGKELRPVVSQRTLFGIPSTVEQAIQKIVEEDEQKRREQRK